MAKKKAKKAKKSAKNSKQTLSRISKKLDKLLEGQQEIKEEEEEIKELEKEELSEEKKLGGEEKEELAELKELEKIEKEVQKQVIPHPLKRITTKDLARGSIGALFGAVAHYTFIYGLKVAEHITFTRAAILFILSFGIGGVFLYATGFRKIRDPKVLAFLPVRLIVLYITAVIMSVIVLWFFEPGFGESFEEAFRQTATITLIAVIGACTADIIGKE